MGDRCYLEVTMRKTDVNRFCEATRIPKEFWDLAPGDPAATQILSMDEANYALCDEISAAAAANIPFTGSHGSGDGYDAEEFVSDGAGNLWYAQVGTNGNFLVDVAQHPDRKHLVPNAEQLVLLNRFWSAFQDVQSDFDMLDRRT